MCNAEHLIENAIREIEAGHDIDDFRALWQTSEMIKYVSCSVEDIWAMAAYVMYTAKPIWEDDAVSQYKVEQGVRETS